jgi:hypothetical protein
VLSRAPTKNEVGVGCQVMTGDGGSEVGGRKQNELRVKSPNRSLAWLRLVLALQQLQQTEQKLGGPASFDKAAKRFKGSE